MRSKKLMLNLISNSISYTAGILVSFVLTPYLINTLGKEVYGYYPLANNFINYMSIITIALNSMAARFITIEISKKEYKKANEYFSSIFFANFILATMLSIVMIVLVLFLDKILNIPNNMITDIKILFSLIFLSMLINIITSVFGVAVFAKDRIDLRSLAEILRNIVRIGLFILLFTLFKPSIIYIGVVTIILEVMTFIIHFNFTKKLLTNIRINIRNFNINLIKEVLCSGIWNSINQLGGILLYGMDLIIGNIFLGQSISGELSIVHTVPNMINGVICMLTGVFMPRITQKYAIGDIEGVIDEIKLSQKIMGVITNIPICMFILFGVEFFNLWVPGNNSLRLQVLSIMTILHLILVGVVWPISNLNIVMNTVKKPSIFMILNGIINIVSMISLLSFTKIGVYAIPMTTMIISILWFGIFIPIYPCKKLGIKKTTFYPQIIRTLVSIPFIFFITFNIKKCFIVNSWVSLIFVGGICSIAALIINIFVMFNIKEIYGYIKLYINKVEISNN